MIRLREFEWADYGIQFDYQKALTISTAGGAILD
jgi:hypothetical protein